jgi:hypothetical protein
MSSPDTQIVSQSQSQPQIDKEKLKEILTKKALDYIKANETLIVLKTIEDEVLDGYYDRSSYAIEEVTRFLTALRYDELMNDIVFDFYSVTLENQLYGYSYSEIQITNISLDPDKIHLSFYLPNGELVTHMTLWYDNKKMKFKEVQEKIKETEELAKRIVEEIVKLRERKDELKEKLEQCEEKEQKEEEDQEEDP